MFIKKVSFYQVDPDTETRKKNTQKQNEADSELFVKPELPQIENFTMGKLSRGLKRT
jgi:hypothetical protein